jgi:hypothetical protein
MEATVVEMVALPVGLAVVEEERAPLAATEPLGWEAAAVQEQHHP